MTAPQRPSEFAATGRRKCSVARVRIEPGDGTITVNKRTIESYFPRESLRQVIAQPLEVANAMGRFAIQGTVNGTKESSRQA